MTEAVAADHLRSFVERVERLEEEIRSLNEDKRDVYAEAKATGFDVPALKRCVARRRKDSADLAMQDALDELYWDALTGASAQATPRAPAPARESRPESERQTTRSYPAASAPPPIQDNTMPPIPDTLRRAPAAQH